MLPCLTFSDRKGVIPCILERILNQRKIAKIAFAAELDTTKKVVLKAREMSYKVVSNGIYGALGCSNALIPLRAIAETTTGLGRRDIERVKQIAESLFTVEKGFTENAQVTFFWFLMDAMLKKSWPGGLWGHGLCVCQHAHQVEGGARGDLGGHADGGSTR